MNDTIRAALYARVSSERQADELTIHSQVAALRQRITADGCQVEPELCFLDEGFSGSSVQRPALERLRDLAYSGVIDRLYVLAPDRLARKYAYQVVLLEEFAKHNVAVIFLNDVAGLGSPEGDLLLQMQGMIAEYERAKILERTRRGRRHAAREGKVSALAHAPYGYRYVPKHEAGGEARYEVMPEASRHVQALFTWVGVEGLSLAEVSRRLRQQGVPTPTGLVCWDRATLRGILLNPAYQGTAKYGKTRLVPRKNEPRAMRGAPRTPRSDKCAVATPAAEQEDIAVPALVSPELFAAAAERLADNRRRYREQKKGAEFLLSGLLVCARCQSAYCGRRHRLKPTAEYVYYRCIGTDRYRHDGDRLCTNASVNGRIEQAVWSDLCSLLREPQRLQQEFEARRKRPAHDNVEVARLQQALAQHKRRIARLIDAYENDWLDKAEFEPRVRAAKDRLARDEAALLEHQRDSVNEEELRLVLGQFEAFAERMRANLEQADFATKRQLLRLLVKRIEVTDQDIRIVYKVSLHPFVSSPSSGGFLQDCLKFHREAQGRAAHPGKTPHATYSYPEGVSSKERFMPQSLAQIYLHLVFSTKERRPFLDDRSIRDETHQYLGGTCNNLDCPVLRVGGVADHVHVLCRMGRTITVADLVRELKRESSKWLKTKSAALTDFHWQNGYGVFSVSPGHVDALRHYIANQEEHHRTISFQDEFRRLLKKYGLEWDERYVWD